MSTPPLFPLFPDTSNKPADDDQDAFVFDEMLDEMVQRRHPCSTPPDTSSVALLQDPRVHSAYIPPQDVAFSAPLAPLPQSCSTTEYDEIKAFLRWNSDPEMTTPPLSDSPTHSLMASPPLQDNLFLNQMNPFSYDPHTLALQPEAYFGFTGYEEPSMRCMSSTGASALHGFELMTDQAHFGYTSISSSSDLSSSMSCLSSLEFQGYPSFHHSSLSQPTFHHQPTPMHQHEGMNASDSSSSTYPYSSTAKAFRWAAAVAANQPTNHTVSMSMIVPQDPAAAAEVTRSCASTSAASTTARTATSSDSSLSASVPDAASAKKQGAVGDSSTQQQAPSSSACASSTRFSPYKKPSSSTTSHKRKSVANPVVSVGAQKPLVSIYHQQQPVKMVKIEQLENQQKWFKAQIAEQDARVQNQRKMERENMRAALMRIVGAGGVAGV
ncbi:hypothetical protein HDU98_001230 [Podochytrium sp. JEL0797]|nr:hypothetical protein HDU98_001230 [Podochytrium sp. JEL0797]